MDYFKKYSSNTLAGSGNQSYFYTKDPTAFSLGRAFFKIYKGGRYNYSILFTNMIDSTFSDGSFSHKNIVCDQWDIEYLKLGICDDCNCETMTAVSCTVPLTFQGSLSKTVMPGEFFYTDELPLDIKEGQYICLEISFRGSMIPHHPESLIPTFCFEHGLWQPSKALPVPCMIGCDRTASRHIGFLGDSITQGIGTVPNSYAHWNAVFSEMLGKDNAYWNLGLGFGRADDAASNSAWLFKAKQLDTVFLCFGTNDILQGYSEQAIINNLQKIVDLLTEKGIQVIVQTLPPFDYYCQPHISIWNSVNRFIKSELSKKVTIFDTVPVLCDTDKDTHISKFGGHPNEEGCLRWAQALYTATKDIL